MGIKSLKIQNFQSHKDSTIEFDPNVTAFIGLNNVGKSSILKALRKLIRDEPKGNIFIRNLPDEATFSSISIITDSNNKVERKVHRNLTNSNSNTYKVITNNNEKFEFTKFSRTGIPDEVLSNLSISPIQTFGDKTIDLNFHIQQDPIFLIKGDGLSSIRSKVLSKITGVDVTQKAIQIGRLNEKNLNNEVERIRKQKDVLKFYLEKYTGLDDLSNLIYINAKNIEIFDKKIEEIGYYKTKLKELNNILYKIRLVRETSEALRIYFDINKIKEKITLITLLKKLYEVNKKLYKSKSILITLQKKVAIDNLNDLLYKKTLINTLLKIKNKIIGIDIIINIKIPSLYNIETLHNNINEFKKYNKFLESLKSNIYMKNKEINTIKITYTNLVNDLESFKNEVGICPYCNGTGLLHK